MAVAVVGDVDPVKAEKWIQDKLGEVPAAAPRGAARLRHPQPSRDLVSVATDPERACPVSP
jgi:predicted Zn-dependent peptidase